MTSQGIRMNMTLVTVIVALLAGYSVASKCFQCRSVCYSAADGVQNEAIDKLNSGSCGPCANVVIDESENSIETKDCGDASCFTALAMIRKTTDDGLKLTVNYTERGCIPTCPTKLCDMSNLESCNFAPKMGADITRRVQEGQSGLNSVFKSVKPDWKNLGEGGELHCCSGDVCNSQTETVLAHKTVRDEL